MVDAFRPWTEALNILRAELKVKFPKGVVDVGGPCGIGSNIYVSVKPTARARGRHITLRPDNICESNFCLRMVSDEATGDYRPNTLGAINGLNFKETGTVETVDQLWEEMERRFRNKKKNTADDS